MNKYYVRIVSKGLFIVFVGISLNGQAARSIEDSVSVKEVVVSANRKATLRSQAPSLVKITNGQLFKQVEATCLADGIDYQPGVRVNMDCRNCGKMEASINGLNGNYTQILVDSRPLFSSSGSSYVLEQLPANMIDRVEVVRGGSSALFGSSAVGGTINVITKRPSHNEAEFAHTFITLGHGSVENNTSINASLLPTSDIGLGFYANNRERSPYDRNGDNYSELTKLKASMVGTRAFANLSSQSSINAHVYAINDFRRGGNLISLPPHEANIAEQTEHTIYGGSMVFNWHSRDLLSNLLAEVTLQDVNRKSYYGGINSGSSEDIEEALKGYGKMKNFMAQAELMYSRHFTHLLFMPAELSVGSSFESSQMEDKSLWYATSFNQYASNVGFYAQNEWKNSVFGILIGLRADKSNQLSNPIFSSRINLRYKPMTALSLRLSYSEGFRSPQYVDEDLHEKLIGGYRVSTVHADGLKEERSHSVSCSAEWMDELGDVSFDFVVEGFYNYLKNAFHDTFIDSDEGLRTLVRSNGSGADIYGINSELSIKPMEWLDLQLGFTWQRALHRQAEAWSENVEAERNVIRTPRVYSYFVVGLKPLKNFDISLSGKHTGSMRIGHSEGSGTEKDVTVSTPSFVELGAKLAYTFNLGRATKIEASMGMYNILNQYQKDVDTSFDRDSEYTYGPIMPRSLYAGIKLNF